MPILMKINYFNNTKIGIERGNSYRKIKEISRWKAQINTTENTIDLLLQEEKGVIKLGNEFEHLGVRLNKEARQVDEIKHKINRGRVELKMLKCNIMGYKYIQRKKNQIYKSSSGSD